MRDPLDTRARLSRIRLRAFAVAVGTALAAFGLISSFALPAWPIIGVAVVTVAALVSRMVQRVDDHHCRDCGEDLRGLPVGQYGTVCGRCGAVNERETLLGERPLAEASIDDADDRGHA